LIKTGTTRPCLTLPPYQGNGLIKTGNSLIRHMILHDHPMIIIILIIQRINQNYYTSHNKESILLVKR
jgi:hypothetical protein